MSESTTMPVCSFCGSGVIPYPGMQITCGCNGTYEKMLYDALLLNIELSQVALTATDAELGFLFRRHPDTIRKIRVEKLKKPKYRSDSYCRINRRRPALKRVHREHRITTRVRVYQLKLWTPIQAAA